MWGLQVNRYVMIKFNIGKYHYEVLCNLVPLQDCHLLLGWPWKYDRDTIYDKEPIIIPLNIKGISIPYIM